jgi:two-component system, NtrC family, sensor kinase
MQTGMIALYFACILIVIGCAVWIVILVRKVKKLSAFCRENEERSQVPEQIRISKQQLETIFDAITDAICIVDRDFSIVRVNKNYAFQVGLPIKKILGNRCCQIFWKCDDVCEDCPAKMTFATGETVLKKRYMKKSPEEVRYYDVSAYPVNGTDGTVVHVIELIRDMTDEKRIFEQLIRSEKLAGIGIMTAGIAHEMNNPLSGISGTAVNLLQMPDKYGLNEKGISRVTTILDSAARATAIMKDLLHLSRKHDNTRVMIDLNATIIKTVNAIHLRGASEIQRRYNLDDTLPLLTCDPLKIEQVVLNVVTNAIQSIQERQEKNAAEGKEYSGLLIISTQRQDDHILVTVTDNGIGIPEKIRSKIFDPFFSTRPTGQGTGLGLSVSHRIIEEHGGRLFFECIDDLVVFSIELPIEMKSNLETIQKESHA